MRKLSLVLILSSLASIVAAPAQTLTERPESTPARLSPVTVVGSKEAARELPGSAAYVDRQDIEKHNYQNVNRVLLQVPGVYVREEDGYGNFPNISLRGVDTSRSAKVTLMEDGVLAAPAPYSAPAAYYSPTAARMSGIEVLKGSSQIKYGPHTTGGVINYLSTPIPDAGVPPPPPAPYSDGKNVIDAKDAFGPASSRITLAPRLSTMVRTSYGSHDDFTLFGHTGGTFDTAIGRVGFLIEGYYRQADGFRTIQGSDGYNGSDDTGFRRVEPMLKLSWEPNTDVYQRFEFKLGYTDAVIEETYVGLTEEDVRRQPHLRYAGTRFDTIRTEHVRTHLRHIIEPTDWFTLTTTAYYSKFHRNWFKLNNVTANGANVDLSRALAEGGAGLDVLRGEAAGNLNVRANNRHYYQWGIETVANFRFETGPLAHSLDAGIRYHYDMVRRNQRNHIFVQDDDGSIIDSFLGPRGDGGNRREEAQSWAFHLQDRVSIGRLTVTPGVRYERIDYQYTDFGVGEFENSATADGASAMDVFAPGIGLNYDFTSAFSAFAGVHKGFSVPGPRANIVSGIHEESSIGYEFGLRYHEPRQGLAAELVLFYTDFDDLLVIDNAVTGVAVTESVGDVNAYGAEFVLAYDPGVAAGWSFSMPNRLALTYTNAELDGDSTSLDPESIFSGGRDGNRVPYVPEYQIHFSTGLVFERYGIIADFTYVPETFATASNVETQLDPMGRPDARYGKTDEYFLVDVTAHYRPTDWSKISFGVKNLFDEEYVVSRVPVGPRTGAPRTFFGAIEVAF